MGPVPQPEEERERPSHDPDITDDADLPDMVINVEESDSDSDDDDDDGYMGYQALSQEPVPDDTQCVDDEDQAETSDACEGMEQLHTASLSLPAGSHSSRSSPQIPDLPRPDKRELLWNQPRQSDVHIDSGHADKIKSAMSGFQLPATNIPDWARHLSEDQWHSQVVSKLVGSESGPTNRSSTAGEGENLQRTVAACELSKEQSADSDSVNTVTVQANTSSSNKPKS